MVEAGQLRQWNVRSHSRGLIGSFVVLSRLWLYPASGDYSVWKCLAGGSIRWYGEAEIKRHSEVVSDG